MGQQAQRVHDLVETVITAMGYECVGVEYLPQGKHSLLRIYIDKPEGISVEDCEAVSRQVSGILDVEDPISGQYSLEVSSPGLDRPLFSLQHYENFIGNNVHIRLRNVLDGRRKLSGIITAVEDDVITISEHGDKTQVPFSMIDKGNLIPEW